MPHLKLTLDGILWLFLWIFKFLHILWHIFMQSFTIKGCKKLTSSNQLHFADVKSASYGITYALRQRHSCPMSGTLGRLAKFLS